MKLLTAILVPAAILLFAGNVFSEKPPPATHEGHGVTAEDQSWDAGQTRLIADIRRDIVGDDSLSTRAHNITIISAEGNKVVLRGSVKNEAEHRKVLEIARRHSQDITDSLKVEPE